MESANTCLKKQTRCINLDWLEVDCLEPDATPKDIFYFQRQGYDCIDRGYGTRVYSEMFVINDSEGHAWLEVRRKPKTPLLDPRDVHLRLHNRTCYENDAANQLRDFIRNQGYVFLRVVRADVCLDFEYFDSGDDPNKFLIRYLNGVYSKINQANVHAHGTDRWEGRFWNSISWGAPTSQIGTKLYNKTMELYDQQSGQFGKPYIRQAWLESGLIDDWYTVTKTRRVLDASGIEKTVVYRPAIWRLEFSIRSSVKNWFVIEKDGKEQDYYSVRNDLTMYDDRQKLLTIFATLCRHYFRFKYYEEGQRKDRCKDKALFAFKGINTVYTLHHPTLSEKTAERPLNILIAKLRAIRERNHTNEIRHACNTLVNFLENNCRMQELNKSFSREELEALQLATSWKFKGDKRELSVLVEEIRKLLAINTDVF